MDASGSLGVIVALLAALVWGSGDYVGGRATRGRHPYQVLALVSLSGLVLLSLAALVRGESWPGGTAVALSAVAGVAGGFGIAALYQGLAVAEAAVVSPTAAVVGVVLPVVIGALTAGLPSPLKIVGMIAGILGIWIVTRGSSPSASSSRNGLTLGLVAGIGFGGFFICMAQVPREAVFTPLVVAKAVAAAFALVVLGIRGVSLPSPRANPVALAAGLLDAGGNVFYLVAAHLTRLDFAALIASMAPAVTVVLAGVFSRQRVSRVQWLGVVLCLAGITFIVA
jgi:drug/metabolite transporter (DMT)-like permease